MSWLIRIALVLGLLNQSALHGGSEVVAVNSPRILVAYGTKTGTTAEVAAFIGRTLKSKGVSAQVASVDQVASLDGYSAVILGSSIRAGQLLSCVHTFAKGHHQALARIPVACFIVCMTLKDDTPAKRQEVRAYLQPLRAFFSPVAEGLFAGRMDYARLGIGARFVVKMMKVPEGDFRNWDAIEAWTNGLLENSKFMASCSATSSR